MANVTGIAFTNDELRVMGRVLREWCETNRMRARGDGADRAQLQHDHDIATQLAHLFNFGVNE